LRANVGIGGTAGVHLFNDDNELGVEDVDAAPSVKNSALFGLRVGVFFTNLLGVEAEVGLLPSEARGAGFGVTSLTYRAHVVAQLLGKNPDQKLIPFVLAGGGFFTVVSADNGDVLNDPTQNVFKDTDGVFYAGIGAKYRGGASWGVRADARVLLAPSSVNNPIGEPDESNITADFEALLSFYVDLGRAKTETKKVAVVDDDPDKDTIRGAADGCPMEPEDVDSYLDDDGCPEPDNDADGIGDAQDKCPIEAEDRDQYQDEDGCPDLDNDGDGVPDAADRCPAEPEDKDGFEDEDGCPDPDNDTDGVPDAQDKCPTEVETKNGFQDDDGCPDEIPDRVKKFTGAIQGVNFKVNSADLLPASSKTLDKAVAVLKEFPELRMEIQGHTDDVAIRKKGKFADNLALSQARAESVLAYFVKKGVPADRLTAKGYGDTSPIEAPAGLKGRKLTQARTRNRRVEFQLVSGIGAPTATTPAAPAPAPAAPAPELK